MTVIDKSQVYSPVVFSEEEIKRFKALQCRLIDVLEALKQQCESDFSYFCRDSWELSLLKKERLEAYKRKKIGFLEEYETALKNVRLEESGVRYWDVLYTDTKRCHCFLKGHAEHLDNFEVVNDLPVWQYHSTKYKNFLHQLIGELSM